MTKEPKNTVKIQRIFEYIYISVTVSVCRCGMNTPISTSPSSSSSSSSSYSYSLGYCSKTTNGIDCEWVFISRLSSGCMKLQFEHTQIKTNNNKKRTQSKKSCALRDNILIVSYILCKTIHTFVCCCILCYVVFFDHPWNWSQITCFGCFFFVSLDFVSVCVCFQSLFCWFILFLSCFASLQLHDYGQWKKNSFG